MKLIFDIVKSGRVTPKLKSFHFTENGGTFGRNDDNDWVLNDLNNYISGYHAKVISKHGTYFIVDESTNGTFLKNPYKKLPKGHPYKIAPSDVFIIGDHELQARFSNNDYSEDDIIKDFEEEVTVAQIIPDDDFLTEIPRENNFEQDSSFIEVDIDEGEKEDTIDEFLYDEKMEDNVEQTHIDVMEEFSQDSINIPEYTQETQKTEPVKQENTTSNIPSDILNSLAILESKLGIEIISLKQEDRDLLMNELGEVILCSLDYLKNSLSIKEKTKQDLHISSSYLDTKDNNPIKLGSNALKLLENKNSNGLFGMMKISDAMQESYRELDAHCIALHSATKNIMKVAMLKFSPKNLEYKFESTGALRGVLPKNQLMWKAYENMFHRLNERPEEGVDMIKEDFTKEYENILYSLKLHTNNIKDK